MKFANLIEVTTHFSDKKVCKDYLAKMRWNGNPTCPHCGNEKVYTMKHNYKCAKCRKQFSETKGTIFENSAIPLQKWFVGIWLFTSHKKGISSIQLGKDIGVTQKSAWFMLQRIRYAMETKTFDKGAEKMTGVVQIDETYIGGDISKMNAKAKSRFENVKAKDTKTPVVGFISENEVRAIKVENADKPTLQAIMKNEIDKNAVVVTDGYAAYNWAKKYYKGHIQVNHAKGEYVRGGYHTNSIEGFWSIFKRGIYGIYHNVSKKHLDRYINEFEFRYNRRELTEANRFEEFVTLINGRRLSYDRLTS